jgi:hypothetical protein
MMTGRAGRAHAPAGGRLAYRALLVAGLLMVWMGCPVPAGALIKGVTPSTATIRAGEDQQVTVELRLEDRDTHCMEVAVEDPGAAPGVTLSLDGGKCGGVQKAGVMEKGFVVHTAPDARPGSYVIIVREFRPPGDDKDTIGTMPWTFVLVAAPGPPSPSPAPPASPSPSQGGSPTPRVTSPSPQPEPTQPVVLPFRSTAPAPTRGPGGSTAASLQPSPGSQASPGVGGDGGGEPPGERAPGDTRSASSGRGVATLLVLLAALLLALLVFLVLRLRRRK